MAKIIAKWREKKEWMQKKEQELEAARLLQHTKEEEERSAAKTHMNEHLKKYTQKFIVDLNSGNRGKDSNQDDKEFKAFLQKMRHGEREAGTHTSPLVIAHKAIPVQTRSSPNFQKPTGNLAVENESWRSGDGSGSLSVDKQAHQQSWPPCSGIPLTLSWPLSSWGWVPRSPHAYQSLCRPASNSQRLC